MTGVVPDSLAADYRHCRRLNAEHGKTFYLATALLPAAQRPHVHALYGFARYADDLVDRPAPGSTAASGLASLGAQLTAALDGPEYPSAPLPVVRAVVATARRFDLDRTLFTDFLAAMTADLTVTRYAGFEELRGYMWGSAAVIGLQLLPILGVRGDPDRARACAADLGIAFQLTNFLRDIGEDYRRGRIYLPADSLAAHGVLPAMFGEPTVSAPLRSLLIAEVARARAFYRRAEPGIALLAPTAVDCVRTAYVLYSQILDEIERLDYEVLSSRAQVPLRRRLAVALPGLARAVRARH